MAKKPAIEITKCGGLKCDNPNCDYVNMNIKVEEYKDWVEKPCPKCGWVLLTKKDYKMSKILLGLVKFLNFILPKRDENDTKDLATMSVKFHGDEKPEIKIEKYRDTYDKVKEITKQEPVIIGSKDFVNEIKTEE
jgi:hypothetical protein